MNGYWWRIKDVPGARLRRLGWRWAGPPPAGKTRNAWGVRWNIGKWLLAVTDDRAGTLQHQGRLTRAVRRLLGRSEREWELAERSRETGQ